MEKFMDNLVEMCTQAGGKILLAIIVFIVGKFVIKKLLKLLNKLKSMSNMDPTAKSYIGNVLKALLYALLFISIISILGVPMASVVAVLASCALAVGMALQGALSNFAGGIMLLIFRPFNVGDYIVTSGEEGTVKSISLIYTVINTVDNKQVSIPNGTLMNASVQNLSAAPERRVDLEFNVSGDYAIDDVRWTIKEAVSKCDEVLSDPAPQIEPLAGVAGGLTYTVRLWTKNEDYWDVYFKMMREIPTALVGAGFGGPAQAVKISND